MTSLDFCTYPDCLDTGGVCTNRSCRARYNRVDRIPELEAEVERLRGENARLQREVEAADASADRNYLAGMQRGFQLGLLEDDDQYNLEQQHRRLDHNKEPTR